jgi:hypothetical protein
LVVKPELFRVIVLPITYKRHIKNWLYISGVPVLLIRVAQLHRTSSDGLGLAAGKDIAAHEQY